MKMHILNGGRLRMRKAVFYPDAPADERIDLPVWSFLLRHRQGNVLFDTGCHPATATDAAARWGGMAQKVEPIHEPSENVVAQLSLAGLRADDIELVICSHLHPDHCGCNVFFPRATLLCHRLEIAAAHQPGAEAQGYLAAEWDGLMPVDTVEGSERDVFGDGRIVLRHLPGHTPGTMGALLTLPRSGRVLLASDAVSVRASLDGNYAPRNTWDEQALLRSLTDVRRLEASGAAVVCGHDPEQAATLRQGADFYD